MAKPSGRSGSIRQRARGASRRPPTRADHPGTAATARRWRVDDRRLDRSPLPAPALAGRVRGRHHRRHHRVRAVRGGVGRGPGRNAFARDGGPLAGSDRPRSGPDQRVNATAPSIAARDARPRPPRARTHNSPRDPGDHDRPVDARSRRRQRAASRGRAGRARAPGLPPPARCPHADGRLRLRLSWQSAAQMVDRSPRPTVRAHPESTGERLDRGLRAAWHPQAGRRQRSCARHQGATTSTSKPS